MMRDGYTRHSEGNREGSAPMSGIPAPENILAAISIQQTDFFNNQILFGTVFHEKGDAKRNPPTRNTAKNWISPAPHVFVPDHANATRLAERRGTLRYRIIRRMMD